MTDSRIETVPVAEPILAQLRTGNGDVRITGSDDDQVRVVLNGSPAEIDRARVDLSYGTLIVDTAPAPDRVPAAIGTLVDLLVGRDNVDVEVQLPPGCRLDLRGGSGEVTISTPVAEAEIQVRSGDVTMAEVRGLAQLRTGSGDIRIPSAGSVQIHTESGDVVVDQASQAAQITTGSGDVRLDRAGGPIAMKTGAGDLRIGMITGEATVTLGSGELTIDQMGAGRLEIDSGSGDVTVTVVAGLPVWTDISTLSGDLYSTLPSLGQPEQGADYLELRARTGSGDIHLRSA